MTFSFIGVRHIIIEPSGIQSLRICPHDLSNLQHGEKRIQNAGMLCSFFLPAFTMALANMYTVAL